VSLADVDPERRADVAIDGIVTARRDHGRQHRRQRSLSAHDALIALQYEAFLVSVAACNLANGVDLNDGDRARLLLAARRIDVIATEAAG
jgi:hypothetical protein